MLGALGRAQDSGHQEPSYGRRRCVYREAAEGGVMSILLTKKTRAIVQGITGKIGAIQARWMLECGTNIVGGVTPGSGGKDVHGIPVYNSVAEAVQNSRRMPPCCLYPQRMPWTQCLRH